MRPGSQPTLERDRPDLQQIAHIGQGIQAVSRPRRDEEGCGNVPQPVPSMLVLARRKSGQSPFSPQRVHRQSLASGARVAQGLETDAPRAAGGAAEDLNGPATPASQSPPLSRYNGLFPGHHVPESRHRPRALRRHRPPRRGRQATRRSTTSTLTDPWDLHPAPRSVTTTSPVSLVKAGWARSGRPPTRSWAGTWR